MFDIIFLLHEAALGHSYWHNQNNAIWHSSFFSIDVNPWHCLNSYVAPVFLRINWLYWYKCRNSALQKWQSWNVVPSNTQIYLWYAESNIVILLDNNAQLVLSFSGVWLLAESLSVELEENYHIAVRFQNISTYETT